MRDLNDAAGQRATAESIERGGGGLSVTDLLAKVTSTGAAAHAPARVRDADDLAATIAEAAGRYLPAGRLAPDADFFDAGGTSVHAVELVAELEGTLGIEVDLDDVFADARPIGLARRWLPALAGEGTEPERPRPAPALGTGPAGAGTGPTGAVYGPVEPARTAPAPGAVSAGAGIGPVGAVNRPVEPARTAPA